MKIRVAAWSTSRKSKVVEFFLQRPAFDAQAGKVAEGILLDVQRRGEAAIMAATAQFDGVALRACDLCVSAEEIAEAVAKVPEDTKGHVQEARRRVAEFATASLRKDLDIKTPHGGTLGEFYRPYDRVGVYVPGGTAPLASTVVMTATLAQVAGVKEIVACTPCDRNKHINPVVLYAMHLCGVTEIYRVGGVQAIGLMAYGMKKAMPVQKIVGPGGAFVTAAKRLVYGTVALDLVAGPSEIAILADETANPAWVAADLLSQAEHGTGLEKGLLVTTSEALSTSVLAALSEQVAKLSRKAFIKKVEDAGGIIIVTVPSLEDGMELINHFAPEHLELMVADADAWRKRVRSAGAVFVGPYTPEAVGDFVAGPSHVLPTGGTARLFSGLTVDDFRRRTSLVSYTQDDLRDALPTLEAFGAMEGLDGHARSASIRFNSL